MSSHSLWASRVSIEKTALSPSVATLKEKFLTFSGYCLVFPLTLVFKSLAMMQCGSFVGFCFLAWDLLSS